MMRAVRISPHPHQQYFGAGLELGFPCVSFVRLVVAAYELVVDDEKYGCNQDENNATHDNFVRESAPSHGNEHPPALSDVIVRFVQCLWRERWSHAARGGFQEFRFRVPLFLRASACFA